MNKTTQHTPEPWHSWRGQILDRPKGIGAMLIAACSPQRGCRCPDDDESANAARIVACVNACAGLSDPASDLAALREALRAVVDASSDGGISHADLMGSALNKARAALARVEGGQS